MHYLNFSILISFLLCFLNVNADQDGSNSDATDADVHAFSNITEINANPSENMTETFNKILSRISKYCLSKKEYEEFYANKARYRFAMSPIFSFLILDSTKQIGLNELRNFFHLKPQKFSNVENIRDFVDFEEPIDEKKLADKNYCKNLAYFKKCIEIHAPPYFATYFWPKDIEVAEKFLDQKFPEIRQVFILAYQNVAKSMNDTLLFDKDTIDKMFKAFKTAWWHIREATEKMHNQSVDGIILWKAEDNFCNKL